jgi:shikimate dehydrogenase
VNESDILLGAGSQRPMTQEITQRTALCGILLHPAAHTRSPAMHNAAFAHLDIDAVYVAFDVPGARLGEAIRGARALALRQLAISIPHKESVIEHLDEIDATAQRIGAVNTVTLRGERLAGSNTDWVGAVCALERADKLDGKNAVVLGAGGTARAVVYGLLERGARVTVLNRTRERAVAVAEALGADGAGSLTDLGTTACDVLVNATSVGLRRDASPVPADAVPADALVLDAVYDPEDTRLLRDAAARGARTISGKWMLIHQAAEQLRLWTGREAPIEVMERAFSAF